MTTKIEVTQEDIYESRRLLGMSDKPLRCNVCPVALAITRAAGEPWSVGIIVASACREFAKEIDLPREASEFIRAFDMDKPVSPFTFTLDIPAPATEGERK